MRNGYENNPDCGTGDASSLQFLPDAEMCRGLAPPAPPLAFVKPLRGNLFREGYLYRKKIISSSTILIFLQNEKNSKPH
jgi:hypothetical protein